jgi:hypothetical protein
LEKSNRRPSSARLNDMQMPLLSDLPPHWVVLGLSYRLEHAPQSYLYPWGWLSESPDSVAGDIHDRKGTWNGQTRIVWKGTKTMRYQPL